MKLTDILWIYILIGVYVVECCTDLDTGKCCFNFYENKSGICEECPFGTFGENCGGRCPPGYFGRLCQEICFCEAEECNLVNGCSSQTDWPSKAMKINPTFPTGPQPISPKRPRPVPPTTWKNAAFIMIGSIGTCVIAAMMYCGKSWYFKKRVHASFTGRTNNTESSVSFHVVNALNRNALGVEHCVNERQQFEIDRQSNHGDVLLQDKWTYHNGECCMPGNSNIYCDLNHDFYENSSGFLGDGSSCDDTEVEQGSDVFQRRNTGSACTSNGVVFKREMPQRHKNHDYIKNETADSMSSVSKTSGGQMGFQISERVPDYKFRPYSSIKYNRYKSKTGNDQQNAPYQSLLFYETEEKETAILHEEPYQDTIPNTRVSFHVVNDLNRNSPAVQSDVNERQQFDLDWQNSKVRQGSGAFETRNSGSVCTSHGVVIKREKVQRDKNHDDTKNETSDSLSLGFPISERISDFKFRPYSSIKHNRYESKTGNDEASASYESLFFKTEEKDTDILPEEPYQDTTLNCKDKVHLNTFETLAVSKLKRNTSYSRLDSEKKIYTGLISHDLEFSNCNVYCNECRESAKEMPIAYYFTRKDTHIEKEGSEPCETCAYLTASRDEHNPGKENVTELHHNGTSLVHPSEDKERISSVSNVIHM